MHQLVKSQTIDMIISNLRDSYPPTLLNSTSEFLSSTLDIYRRLYDHELEQDLKTQ